jgi:hypothetical protein
MALSGEVLVGDCDPNKLSGGSFCGIRKVTRAGVVTTLAGNGQGPSVDGTGTSAMFHTIDSLAVNPVTGALYIGDYGTIRKVNVTSGAVTTILGNSSALCSTRN